RSPRSLGRVVSMAHPGRHRDRARAPGAWPALRARARSFTGRSTDPRGPDARVVLALASDSPAEPRPDGGLMILYPYLPLPRTGRGQGEGRSLPGRPAHRPLTLPCLQMACVDT